MDVAELLADVSCLRRRSNDLNERGMELTITAIRQPMDSWLWSLYPSVERVARQ
jgi:hypothetical protein